ncbi:hypothetical protein WMY93_008217 [Mugilogobius chulae]|uniref:SH2 domain-containing protein n=1 Tax=Mugilogobius chulae TaxID=88201 RepID=A0AAW0PIE1_9GOBI
MAEQGEPLYDFPEPSQTSKFKGHQRSRGSLKSISVLDRLLLTVPVWLQLSINPATALHILQREPPGTFLVRNSRTSQKKVLCVRLADNTEPSFVQQFDIQEEHSTFSLVTSTINFPDLPRLISFYCVSSDVLPFPLELPEAIARAQSHKELESISHMGIEFWSSHLNIRGPREAPKPPKDPVKKPDSIPTAPPPPAPSKAPPPPAPPTASEIQPKQDQTDPNHHPAAPSEPQQVKGDASAALFKEFCPIKTRTPEELNYGSGIGGLCFINPLFLQSLNAWSRRRMFKRSLKVRVSTESSTLLSPPQSPPPPPPLMPKSKGRCKAKEKATKQNEKIKDTCDDVVQEKAETNAEVEEDYTKLPSKTREEVPFEDILPLPAVKESLIEDVDYKQPSPCVNASHPLSQHLLPKLPKKSPRNSPATSPAVSPYQSPVPSPKMLSPLLPFASASSPKAGDAYDIPTESATLLSPPQSPPPPPQLMPKSKGRCKAKEKAAKHNEKIKDTCDDVVQEKAETNAEVEEDYTKLPSKTREEVPFEDILPLPAVKESLIEDVDYKQPSPCVNASHPLSQHLLPKLPKKSPRNSPSTSPAVLPYQSPVPSPKMLSPLLPFASASSPKAGDAYDIPVSYSKLQMAEVKEEVEEVGVDEEVLENELVHQINAASLNDKDSSSLSSQEEAQEEHSVDQ